MIVPILLYGSETGTLKARQQKRLDGTYTRLLMRVKNISSYSLNHLWYDQGEYSLLVTALEQPMRLCLLSSSGNRSQSAASPKS